MNSGCDAHATLSCSFYSNKGKLEMLHRGVELIEGTIIMKLKRYFKITKKNKILLFYWIQPMPSLLYVYPEEMSVMFHFRYAYE